MSLIADASVLVKVLASEEDSETAIALLKEADEIVCPDLVLAEAFMALWKKHRRGELPREHLEQGPEIIRNLVTRTVPLSELFDRAAELSRSLDHPIYDCFYLALAVREKLPLVTADARMLEAARRLEGVEAKGLM